MRQAASAPTPAARSLVAIDLLAALVHFLRLEAERRDGPRIEPRNADRFARFLAIAVGPIVDPLECSIDLGNQLALAVARPELKRTVAFRRSAIGHVRMVLVLLLEIVERLPTLAEN